MKLGRAVKEEEEEEVHAEAFSGYWGQIELPKAVAAAAAELKAYRE